MKIIIIILVLGYLLACLGMYLLQRRMLYFAVPALDVKSASRCEFDVGDLQLKGWVVNEGKEKALIYYGGNAEQVEQHVGFFREVAAQYSVYLVPYRGYADNPGAPSEASLYSDAEAIYDQIAKTHKSISLMGRSLGSGVAIYMAVNSKIDKLILATPYDSIENVAKENYWMFPVKFMIKDRFPSWQRAAQVKVDTLVLVAGADDVISHDRSENLIKYLPEALTKVVIINTALHNDISAYPRFFEEIKLQLEKE